MRRRTLLVLGGAAAVTITAAILLAPERVEHATLEGEGGLAFPGLAGQLAAARRIELRRHDGAVTLERRGEAWVLPEKGGYPARPDRVRELLVGLTELRLAERRTADATQLDRLGLDDPARQGSSAVLVRVLDEGGRPLAELVVGRRRVRTQGRVPESAYVRRPAETQAWLAEGRLPVDADAQLWLDRDIANLPADRVRRVEVRRADQPPLVLARDGAEERLALLEPAEGPPADEVALDEVGRAFEFLTFHEVRPAAEVPGEALGEARFILAGELAITVLPHREGEALWIRLAAEGGAEAERLDARWSGWAYQVGPWKERAFLPRLEELRRREAEAAPPAAPR
ncbi:DUF4340 domain-containing protein [Crenalkalicoccus roseus]|uniref:DUF4340 domain-containing protein n=1 Tax=Crenalkalicoccus roseus TaxID=1485588 RepID=UPI001081C580|nr:DUF4340 domain-containing protein [Crenalkalicoccus roseus]